MIQAAIAGLGLALVPRFLVEDETSSGRLVLVGHGRAVDGEAYYLAHPERKRHDPALEVFRAWLQGESAAFEESSGEGRAEVMASPDTPPAA
ncbi:MAG: hypothetical protein GC151_16025 [Betaproteobacteria bacterium]|nr:hypothetical protein [Betaproteobacteria bacterium]